MSWQTKSFMVIENTYSYSLTRNYINTEKNIFFISLHIFIYVEIYGNPDCFMLRPCLSSTVFIHRCHPRMTSSDGRVIHGWHPRMTLPSMDDIQGWHFHQWMRFLHPWMGFSFFIFLVKIASIIFLKENFFPMASGQRIFIHLMKIV